MHNIKKKKEFKMKKSKIGLLVIGLMLVGQLFAVNLGLYSSLTSSGTTMGGLRIDTGVMADQATCVDLSFTSQGSNSSYFIDGYWGNFGLAVSGATATNSTIALMFAVEQPITDKVALGIAFPIASKTGNQDVVLVGSFDFYGVVMF
jgi:hypothetical protein